MLLLFSIGTFLTNYDVINTEQANGGNYVGELPCLGRKMEGKSWGVNVPNMDFYMDWI